MKLFQTHYHYDFGHEWYLNIGVFKHFTLIELTVRWDDYFTWVPYVGIHLIGPTVFSFWTQIAKFYFSICFINYMYPKDLDNYKSHE